MMKPPPPHGLGLNKRGRDMLDILLILAGFLGILTLVVFVHEWGHYWAARRCGVVVEVFSVGFGRELFGWDGRDGTRWRFSAIPLGGYVRMRGDSGVASIPSQGAARQQGSFMSASLASRAFIVAMGPIANFILGAAIFAAIFFTLGKPITPPVIDDLTPGGAADTAGLLPGDRILSVNGYGVDDFNDLRLHVAENPERAIALTIRRDGRDFGISVIPDAVRDECGRVLYGRLGVMSHSGEMAQLGLTASIGAAVAESYALTLAIMRGLGRLISGQANQGEIGGPIKIAEITGMATKQAVRDQQIARLLLLIAALSINLGFINLLPIPALDGGHLAFFGLEAVMRRPLSRRVQEWVMRVGMAFLLSLIILVTFFDILSLTTAPC